MSFYSDASLVLIPSGYKNQKIYSAKPTDGLGDLVFSRASDATRVASNGLIEKVRTNVLLQSNSFDTTWVNIDTTETSGQAGYDGTNNAWLLDVTSGSTAQRIQQTISASGSLTYSVYLKAGSLNWSRVLAVGTSNASAYFNIQTGVVGATVSGCTATIASAGNGYYRCSISFDTTVSDVRIYPATGDGNITQASGNIYIQNAQLEAGDIATNYIATTTTAVSVGPVSGLPRLDYLNSSCPRLLLEPAATALNQFSEQLDNAYWTGSAVVTANTTISPDGYQSADTLNDNTTAYLDKRRLISITPNATHTFSFFVKKTTGSLTHYAGIGVLLTGGTAVVDYGIINTTTGAINRDASSNINSVSYSSVSYGDYWRVIMTFTDNQSNPNCTLIIYPAISSNGTSISSNAQGSNVFWGVNLTQSAYATSYIPTLSTSVTRVADFVQKTSISSLIGQTEGVFFLDYTVIKADNTTSEFSISNGSNGTAIRLRQASGNFLQAVVQNGGSTQASIITSTSIVVGQRYKIALAYKENDFAFYVNGVLIGVDGAGTVPACSQIQNTTGGASTSANLDGAINQVLLFKTRLTNDALASLTTL